MGLCPKDALSAAAASPALKLHGKSIDRSAAKSSVAGVFSQRIADGGGWQLSVPASLCPCALPVSSGTEDAAGCED